MLKAKCSMLNERRGKRMEIKVVDRWGRVVIPVGLRRRFKMKIGTKVTFINNDDGFEVKVVDKKYFDSLAGVLGLKGLHLKSLMEGKNAERML